MSSKNKKITAFKNAAFILMGMALIGCLPANNGGDSAQKSQQSKLQEVLDRGYVIVGTGSTNVPWHFKDDQGNYLGFDIEMGKILAKGLFGDASKVQFVEQSPDARIPNILTGKVDITFQFMTISPPRAQQVAFSVPYYTEAIGLILPAGGKYKNYKELVDAQRDGEQITISVLQNVDAASRINIMIEGAKADQYENQGLVYQAINSQRADAAVVDLSSILWLASKQPEKYLDSGFSFSPQNYGAAMNPYDQVWINFVNTILIDAMTGNTFPLYRAAYKEYFGKTLVEPKIGLPTMFQ